MGNIVLQISSATLDEVTIVGVLPKIAVLPDKTVVSVQNSLLENAIDGKDMLKKTPGLLVRGNDDISVIGSGTPVFYINNRRVHSMDEINNLDPKNIKSVEIIHNPSSEYDSDAAAVIKIITMRNYDDISLRIGGDLIQSRKLSEDAFANVTFHKNKFTASALSLSYKFGKSKAKIEEKNVSDEERGRL